MAVTPAIDRLHVRIDVAPAGCWLWTAGLTNAPDGGGYGKFYWDGKTWLAHRAAWVMYRGAIPAGMTIDHLCRVRRCVNPAHLRLATMRQNILAGGGVCAENARKITCKRGHAYTPENTGRQPHGRFCRICRRDDFKRYRLRKKARTL
jgi:hypothetical protein